MAGIDDAATGSWQDGDAFEGDNIPGVYLDPANLITGKRPSGNNGDDRGASGDSPGDGGTAPKRRGRQPGTKNKPKSAVDVKSQAAGIEKLLLSLHTLAAAGLKYPELLLDQAEAKSLAEAIANVERHYSFGLSEKSADWGNLMLALGTVYGTRAMAIKWRLDQENK